jgi:predicted NBD/HSP70 family sugar kinase
MKSITRGKSRRILVLDVGGTHVKAAFSHHRAEVRILSGRTMTPTKMVGQLNKRLLGRKYDVVSMGYPGLVTHGKISRDPPNLGKGWVGFDFARALGHPTRILNDAAMQALGSYQGGHMLFLGLGTGLGSAMVVDGVLQPMELAHLPYRKGRTFEDFVGEGALRRLGKKRWKREVFDVVETLSAALEPDDVVIGGGNLRKLKRLPPGTRPGDNRNAFVGGVLLWTDGAPAGGIAGVSVRNERGARRRRPGRPPRRPRRGGSGRRLPHRGN